MSGLTIVPLLDIQAVSCGFFPLIASNVAINISVEVFFLSFSFWTISKSNITGSKLFIFQLFLHTEHCGHQQCVIFTTFTYFLQVFLNVLQFGECKLVLHIYFNSHSLYLSEYILSYNFKSLSFEKQSRIFQLVLEEALRDHLVLPINTSFLQ